jgi:hypothetical protein
MGKVRSKKANPSGRGEKAKAKKNPFYCSGVVQMPKELTDEEAFNHLLLVLNHCLVCGVWLGGCDCDPDLDIDLELLH